jgi:hypothetical protein
MDLADRAAVIETVCRMTFCADRRDFVGLSGCYGKVIRQYDLKGRETGRQTNDALIAGAREVLPGYDVLFHLCTNHFVTSLTESRAEVTYNVYCVHAIGDEKMVNLSYVTNILEKEDGVWRIVGSRGEFLKQFGNTKLGDRAREIAKAKAGRPA